MVICGYKPVDFTGKDGNRVTGYSVYTLDEFSTLSDGVGCISDKVFISREKFDEFKISSLCKTQSPVAFLYNKFGKVSQVVAL